jgi:hypothetical protein
MLSKTDISSWSIVTSKADTQFTPCQRGMRVMGRAISARMNQAESGFWPFSASR